MKCYPTSGTVILLLVLFYQLSSFLFASNSKPTPPPTESRGEKEAQEPAYLLLSCTPQDSNEIKSIQVYDPQGRLVVEFPPEPNKNRPAQMVALAGGNYGILISTGKGPIIGQMEINSGQKRNVNLSRWVKEDSNAEFTIITSPPNQRVNCNGVPLESHKVWLTIGTHRMRIDIPGFQANEQTVMVLDNSPQNIALSITMARLQFQLPALPPKSKPPRILVNGTTVSKLESHVIMSGEAIIQIFENDSLVGNFQIQAEAGQQILLELDRLKSGHYNLVAKEIAPALALREKAAVPENKGETAH